MEADPFDLGRFLQAQAGVIEDARAEIASARKRTHWMWFVFPQLAALGRSSTAQFYGIRSLEEARAYAAHQVLGSRLRDCCGVLLTVPGRTAHEIFGSPDDLKLRSCLTLFAQATPEEPVYGDCLDRFFGGEPDEKTLALLTG